MIVFLATSKRFYGEAERFVKRLKNLGVTVYHPYFHLDARLVDGDPELKARVTLQHFSEIDANDTLYAFLPDGYIGYSVTMEIAYAYAKGKSIIASELPGEFAVRPLISEVLNPAQFLSRLEGK